ncbi:Lrp/AsnC family transcriptional regulator [Candidatus Woesearchaeota archaeon]|nr:Lrp/AsnC family transcriptional regulator [Candidatus Woesearchaeota archaeon]
MELNKRNRKILAYLRRNARVPLAGISTKAGIPIGSVLGRMRSLEKKAIAKYTSLIDFAMAGYPFHIAYTLQIKREQFPIIVGFLAQHPRVNTLQKLSDSTSLFCTALFRNFEEVHHFQEQLEQFFPETIYSCYISQTLRQEDALTEIYGIDLEKLF